MPRLPLSFLYLVLGAQEPLPARPPVQSQPGRPGPAGLKREVERIRSRFHPQARLIAAARHPEKRAFLRPVELETILTFAVPQWEQAFCERGTGDRVQRLEGPADYTGVNALQCVWDGRRCWITHLAFQNTWVPARSRSGSRRYLTTGRLARCQARKPPFST